MSQTDRKREWTRAYIQRPEVKAKRKERLKKWEEEHRQHRYAQRREHQLRQKYGLTQAAVEAMIAGQGGVCAICGLEEWGKKGPMVDHDHATGLVRGILCWACNTAVGMVRDRPEIADKVASYLRGQ